MSIKSYKFRLYPDVQQASQLDEWFDMARFLYNKMLSLRNSSYLAYKSTVNIGDIDMNLNDFVNLSTYENMANYIKVFELKHSWIKASNK